MKNKVIIGMRPQYIIPGVVASVLAGVCVFLPYASVEGTSVSLMGILGGGVLPVLMMVMAMIMLYFFRQFSQKGVGSVLIKFTAALWLLKDKQYFRAFGGFAVTILCSIFSPAYAAASISFLILHFYSGERGKFPHAVNYLFYPVLLAVAAAVQMLSFFLYVISASEASVSGVFLLRKYADISFPNFF